MQMNQKNKIFVFILLMSFTSIIGQTIKGKVTDENGEPIPFVNVLEKETVNGVSTDDKGEFTLNVKKRSEEHTSELQSR